MAERPELWEGNPCVSAALQKEERGVTSNYRHGRAEHVLVAKDESSVVVLLSRVIVAGTLEVTICRRVREPSSAEQDTGDN